MHLAARTAKTGPSTFKKRSQEVVRDVSSLDPDLEHLGFVLLAGHADALLSYPLISASDLRVLASSRHPEVRTDEMALTSSGRNRHGALTHTPFAVRQASPPFGPSCYGLVNRSRTPLRTGAVALHHSWGVHQRVLSGTHLRTARPAARYFPSSPPTELQSGIPRHDFALETGPHRDWLPRLCARCCYPRTPGASGCRAAKCFQKSCRNLPTSVNPLEAVFLTLRFHSLGRSSTLKTGASCEFPIRTTSTCIAKNANGFAVCSFSQRIAEICGDPHYDLGLQASQGGEHLTQVL